MIASHVHPTASFPSTFGMVCCPFCGEELAVDSGLAPIEAVWLHEYDCPEVFLLSSAN